MTPRDPRLTAFTNRFGPPHLDLACHAALPMALTPDLLYRLWAHFRSDVHGAPLHIPWVAVADLLLSPLCHEVGFDLYEMNTELRTALLGRLKAEPRFGPQRLQALADFLLTYHQQSQLESDDPDLRELAQVQRWAALAQTQPTQVVRDLAQTLVVGPAQTGVEWGRVALLLERLALTEGDAQALRHYALGMATLTAGELQPALSHFRQVPGGGHRQITVAGVALTMPTEIRQQLQAPPRLTRRRWMQWVGWGTVGTVGAVWLYRVLEADEVAAPNPLQRQDVTFPIAVVTVDAQGAEVDRQSQSVNGIRWLLESELGLDLVQIPAGRFLMGSPETEAGRSEDEGPQHPVTVPAFAMGRYPVTQAQWRFVAGLERVNRDLEPDPSRFPGDDRPVETVSWEEAVEFCDRLSAWLDVPCRLPSEAEWEYACRAGTTTAFHFGETITPDLANYNGEVSYGAGPTGPYRGETTPVGSFRVANGFGLYDMHGNVWEWCQDTWHDSYQGAPTDGSAWVDGAGTRLLRGGSWFNVPRNCRSAYRSDDDPANRLNDLGFRVAVSVART